MTSHLSTHRGSLLAKEGPPPAPCFPGFLRGPSHQGETRWEPRRPQLRPFSPARGSDPSTPPCQAGDARGAGQPPPPAGRAQAELCKGRDRFGNLVPKPGSPRPRPTRQPPPPAGRAPGAPPDGAAAASHLRHVCGAQTSAPRTIRPQTSDGDSPRGRKRQQEHLLGSAPQHRPRRARGEWRAGARPGAGLRGGGLAPRGRGRDPGVGGAGARGGAFGAAGALRGRGSY